MHKTLGSGTYSRVVLDISGKAIKKIVYKNIESAVREIAILSILSHPNIVHLEEVQWTPSSINLVMKRYASDLDIEMRKSRLSIEDIYKFTHDILSAMAYMHSVGVIHCDIKPENILVENNTATLCDFGISVVIGEKYSRGNIQTCTFRAPEIDADRYKLIYRDKVDIWSIGCLLYEMCTGQQFAQFNKDVDDSSIYASMAFGLPVMNTRKKRLEVIHTINSRFIKKLIGTKLTANYKRLCDDGFVSLIAKCLHPNVHKRLSAEAALGKIQSILGHYSAPLLANNTIAYLPSDYDDLSILINLPESLIKVCSRIVIACAQRIYDRITKPSQYSEEMVKSCCIYLAACIFAANVSIIREIVDYWWKVEKIYICAYIMRQIDGHVV